LLQCIDVKSDASREQEGDKGDASRASVNRHKKYRFLVDGVDFVTDNVVPPCGNARVQCRVLYTLTTGRSLIRMTYPLGLMTPKVIKLM
jgi:hypothetical protein